MHQAPFLSLLSQNATIHPQVGAGGPLRRLARGMQGLLVGGRGAILTSLANEAGPDRVAMTGLSNELGLSDGWAVIRYGIHPNERGLQRFAREDAVKMVGYFKNAWNTIKRAFVGMPIYRGHPDMADSVGKERDREKDPAKRTRLVTLVNEILRRWPDRTVYGAIADMEVRDEGLALKPVLTEAGAALVNESGLKYFSPHWLGIPLPKTDGGPEHACVYLCSIGLTDRPNIAGTSLVNASPEPVEWAGTSFVNAVPAGAADTNPQSNPAMKEILIKLLAALGRPLANEATEPQVQEAATAAIPVAASLLARPEATALANEQTARTGAESKVTELTTALANEQTALANEKTAHAAAVEAHATTLIAHAITAGRITEAQKPVWLGRLKRDFAAESVALANEQPVVKTTPRTRDLGARKPASAAGDQFTALVNEAMPNHGNNWTAAWNAVKATEKGKALFEQMKTTEATK